MNAAKVSAQAGFSLVELVVATALAGLVLGAGVRLFRVAAGAAVAHAARIEAEETLRVSSHVLMAELRLLDPAADLRVPGSDAVALRAFRGAGVVCADGERTLVRYRGLRQPDASKDSVVVFDSAGRAVVRELRASTRESRGCTVTGDELLLRWRLPDPVPVGTLLLVFEHGSYHLANDALRYVRGAAGQQPLTAETLDLAASGFEYRDAVTMPLLGGVEPAVFEVDLATLGGGAGGRDAAGLARLAAASRRLRIPLPNSAGHTAVEAEPW